MYTHVHTFVQRYPHLKRCIPAIQQAITVMEHTFRDNGKLLVCGNGGSAADSDHIVSELMKSFQRPRPIPEELQAALTAAYPHEGSYLADKLEVALPTIALVNHGALATATSNDIDADMLFAQQVYGYGRGGDVLLAISTSGLSRNVCHALRTARVLGLHTVGLTGVRGGDFLDLCDIVIRVPAETPASIQELHLPIYHLICAVLEETFFPCTEDKEDKNTFSLLAHSGPSTSNLKHLPKTANIQQ